MSNVGVSALGSILPESFTGAFPMTRPSRSISAKAFSFLRCTFVRLRSKRCVSRIVSTSFC